MRPSSHIGYKVINSVFSKVTVVAEKQRSKRIQLNFYPFKCDTNWHRIAHALWIITLQKVGVKSNIPVLCAWKREEEVGPDLRGSEGSYIGTSVTHVSLIWMTHCQKKMIELPGSPWILLPCGHSRVTQTIQGVATINMDGCFLFMSSTIVSICFFK